MICTGSQLERVLACPVSAVLPQDPDEGSAAAELGSAKHQFLDACAHVGRDAALEQVPPEHYEECEAIDVASMPVHLTTEVAFGLGLSGAITEFGHLDPPRSYYQFGEVDFALTVDLLGVSDDAVYVGDYKTGHARVTPAGKNPQLLLGALCATRAHGRDTAIVEIVRPGQHGAPPWKSTASVDEFDLALFEADLHTVARSVDHLRQFSQFDASVVSEGEHCRYCPAYRHCPAKQRLATRATDGNLAQEVEIRWAGGLSERTAPDAYRQFLMVKQLYKRMSDILHAHAKEHPIDLGDGRVFGPRTKPGNEKLDGDVAWKAVERLFGEAVADDAVTRSATKSGIRKALRAAGDWLDETDKQPLAARERAVLEAIREEGGATRGETTTICEHKVKQ